PAGLKTRSGLLWFPTLKGIAVIDPRPRPAESPAPEVVLEEMVVDETAAVQGVGPNSEQSAGSSPGAALAIGPGRHRLEFHYTGLRFSAPERLRFRYRLEGLDPDWVEAGARRIAFYSYVPPGDYRFRVIACNSQGVWNTAGASLALSVAPHVWQAHW